jgi:hypothetical protein
MTMTMTPIVARMRLSLLSMCLLALLSITNADVNEAGQETYPIDSSWAITSANLTDAFGDKQALYDTFMKKCDEALQKQDEDGGWDCSDETRIGMNFKQPKGMRVSCTRMYIDSRVCPLYRSNASSYLSSYLILLLSLS